MNPRYLSRFSNKNFDLLVVGGGINGAAIANLAASLGLSVALVEKNDWASGTSSKSTKLLHGGIRYLENFEFDLVAESLKERHIQWKSVPHLVKPMRFIVPVYRGVGRPLWMMKLGVWLYDFLSGKYSLGSHGHLSLEEMARVSPGIRKEGLLGGVSYFDAQMDDARICLENVLMARKRGAQVANYCEVTDFLKENGRTVGVRLYDAILQDACEVRANNIVVAAGPWADFVRHKDTPRSRSRLRTTKGVHVVLRGNGGQDAFLLQSLKDKRIFFMIPFWGNRLIGTTDTDYAERPDDVRTDQQDLDYLLSQARQFFPKMDFSLSQVICTFAGLRPLVHEHGSPSKISRKHVIERNYSGVYYVMGGKYTTYRAIALDCVREVFPRSKDRLPVSESYKLYGSGLGQVDLKSEAARYGVDTDIVSHLMSLYGSRFVDVLHLVRLDPSLKAKICPCGPVIRAQIVYSIDTEMAASVEDIYVRRLGLGYQDCPTQQCLREITQILKKKGFLNEKNYQNR